MTRVQGGCHCGAVCYQVDLDDEKFPLQGDYCHCDDCRLTIGFFCGQFASVPADSFTLTQSVNGALVRYNASERLTRTHCSTCGTSISVQNARDGSFHIITPSIEIPPGMTLDSLVKPDYHIYIDSTVHGGISTIIDDGLPRHTRWPTDPLWQDSPVAQTQSSSISQVVEDNIHGGCHCKGIQFTIRRPPENFMDDPVLRDWIKLGRRFSAVHCFCDTCRKVSGAPFWSWAFVPRKLITFTSNATEVVYRSHPTNSIERRFCGKCGCNFSYTQRPDMWDMSVATLDKSKVEAWLEFRPSPPGEDQADDALGRYINGWLASDERRPISYAEDGEQYNPGLVEAVRRGLARSERF